MHRLKYCIITTLPDLTKKNRKKLAHKRISNFINKFKDINSNHFEFAFEHNTSSKSVLEVFYEAYEVENENKAL